MELINKACRESQAKFEPLKIMKKIIAVAVSLFISIILVNHAFSQDTTNNGVVVHKDPRIELLMSKQAQINEETSRDSRKTGKGYRLLVISTNNRDVDSLMKGPNFLDVLKFREARFTSTRVTARGGDRYEAQGKLTIRDVTRDVVLPFSLAIVDDPAQPGRVRATARGRLALKRLDFGVGRNEWASTGQVSNEVTVDLTVVASRPR